MRNFKKRKSTSRVNAMEKAGKVHRSFNLTVTLEDWLRLQASKGRRVTFEYDIHDDVVVVVYKAFPGLSDETVSPIDIYEGYCMRFNVEPKNAIDNLMKYLREKPVREKIITSPEMILH